MIGDSSTDWVGFFTLSPKLWCKATLYMSTLGKSAGKKHWIIFYWPEHYNMHQSVQKIKKDKKTKRQEDKKTKRQKGKKAKRQNDKKTKRQKDKKTKRQKRQKRLKD